MTGVYPGKLTAVKSFCLGCTGRIDRGVIAAPLDAVAGALAEKGVTSAAPPAAAKVERARQCAD